MATDNIHARKEEKKKINIQNASELKYLATKFGVTQRHILEAVRSDGDSEEAIENYLKKNNISLVKNT